MILTDNECDFSLGRSAEGVYKISAIQFMKMRSPMRPLLIALIALAGALVLPGQLFAQQYNIVDLGALGGDYPEAQASAINNAGDVVGNSFYLEAGVHRYRATLFGDAGNKDLGTLGGPSSFASSINESGQIVGSASLGNAGPNHATLFGGTGGNNRDLGTLGGESSSANSINNHGQIVGEADAADGQSYATLFDTMGNANTNLAPNLPGSAARKINSYLDFGANLDAGTLRVVGTAGNQGIMFQGEALTPQQITGAGSVPSDLYDVDEYGASVGYGYNASNQKHAFLFGKGGNSLNNVDLGTLGSGTSSVALATDSYGSVILGWSSSQGDLQPHGFIYGPHPGTLRSTIYSMTDLNVAGSGVIVTSANGINDWGQIAATGLINGKSHALRLDPTAPPTTLAPNTEIRFIGGRTYNLRLQGTSQPYGVENEAYLLDGTVGSGGRDAKTGRNRDVWFFFYDSEVYGDNSEVFSLSGIRGPGYADTVVVEVHGNLYPVNGKPTARLGVFQYPSKTWALAVNSNIGGTPNFVGDRPYNPATDFHLGTYGVDSAYNSVWAVINQDGDFKPIADPAANTEPMVTPSPVGASGGTPAQASSIYMIRAKAFPMSSGQTLGGRLYLENHRVTLKARARINHQFLRWTESGKTVSKSGEYTFIAHRKRTLVAVFN